MPNLKSWGGFKTEVNDCPTKNDQFNIYSIPHLPYQPHAYMGIHSNRNLHLRQEAKNVPSGYSGLATISYHDKEEGGLVN